VDSEDVSIGGQKNMVIQWIQYRGMIGNGERILYLDEEQHFLLDGEPQANHILVQDTFLEASPHLLPVVGLLNCIMTLF
jgi:hypothetical protein